ncbi:MAG TPA: helix-turn-helix domain-containing protein [Terracidiphilus sp.]|nr:helix-turn-helix domain-containing protein [Terracidiphilus sp.]
MIPRILCPHCELKQAPAQQCRRCQTAFTYPAEIGDSLATRPLPTLAQAERELIQAAMALYGNDAGRAAKAIGIGRTTLYRKMKGYR